MVDITVGRQRVNAFLNPSPSGPSQPDPEMMVRMAQARAEVNEIGRNDAIGDGVARIDEYVAQEFMGQSAGLRGYGQTVLEYGNVVGAVADVNAHVPLNAAGNPVAPLAAMPAAAPVHTPYVKRPLRP